MREVKGDSLTENTGFVSIYPSWGSSPLFPVRLDGGLIQSQVSVFCPLTAAYGMTRVLYNLLAHLTFSLYEKMPCRVKLAKNEDKWKSSEISLVTIQQLRWKVEGFCFPLHGPVLGCGVLLHVSSPHTHPPPSSMGQWIKLLCLLCTEVYILFCW